MPPEAVPDQGTSHVVPPARAARLPGITQLSVLEGCHLDIIIAWHHDDSVRTTLTLEPDVAERLRKEIRRTGRGLKATINEALRRGLGMGGKPVLPARFEVEPHAFGFKPGIDLDRANQLVDELEVEEVSRTLRR